MRAELGVGTLKPLAALFAASALLAAHVAIANAAGDSFRIFYRGQDDLVLERLKLDPSTVAADSLADAQAAVVQDALPTPGPELDALKARVESGMGLLLILGSHTDPAAIRALTDGALEQIGAVRTEEGPERGQELERIAAVIAYTGPPADALRRGASWGSAVRIHERSILKADGRAQVLVATVAADKISPHDPILVRVRQGKGTIYVLSTWLKQGDQPLRERSYLALLGGIKDAQNYDLQRWGYFNWLLYYLSRDSAGVATVPYGVWIAAPVPKARDVRILTTIFLSVFGALLGAFIFTRRYSMRHPEKLDQFYRQQPDRSVSESCGAAAPAPREAIAGAAAPTRADPRWEVIGFHRPLSGFLYNYSLSLFIMIPLGLIVTFYVERTFVNPFVQERGAWALVVQFMLFFFVLLDVGTGQAMVKYFAEFRITEPGRAIMYTQFFIWFHALAGIFQITVLGLGAAIFLPHSSFAYLTWFLVLHSLIQFPGFILIYFNLFRALQRFDYAQLLIVLAYVLNPLLQTVCGIYMRHWGLLHPAYGEGMGVVFGFAIGGFISNLLLGVFCSIFYHKVGLKLATIFMAHFNYDTVKRSLIYGAKLTGGQALAALSWGVVPLIMLIRLENSLELLEIFILTYALTFAYIEIGCYIFTTLMPTISESFSHQKMALTRRYLDQGLRWGIMFSTMLGGAYVAFSDALLRGLLPPQFARAAAVIALAHMMRVPEFFTRLPDQVFQGTGRTGLFTWTALVEQVSRMVLTWYLIGIYGFPGVFYAFAISSALKAILAWPLMIGLVVAPAISVWQTLVNPMLTGIASYLILRSMVVAIWLGPGHALTAAIAVVAALLGSLPIYMFISGLLGWDRQSLDDFRNAAELVPAPFGGLIRLAHRVVEAAAALSPLQDRFPGKLIENALAEAAALTASKVELR